MTIRQDTKRDKHDYCFVLIMNSNYNKSVLGRMVNESVPGVICYPYSQSFWYYKSQVGPDPTVSRSTVGPNMDPWLHDRELHLTKTGETHYVHVQSHLNKACRPNAHLLYFVMHYNGSII